MIALQGADRSVIKQNIQPGEGFSVPISSTPSSELRCKITASF